MWEQELPEEADLLRQGDLLSAVPFPRRGTMELTVDELRANVYPSRFVVVLDQCCTVAQKHTVLLGRVADNIRRLPDDNRLMISLQTEHPAPGVPYAKYLHLLQPINEVLPDKPKQLWVVEMTERLSLAVKSGEDLAWLQAKRVARMDPVSRAKLRAKLLFHFGELAEEDEAGLHAAGVDSLGRPLTS